MGAITPRQASKIVDERNDSGQLLTRAGEPRKYAFRHKIGVGTPNGRHISIAAKNTADPLDAGTADGVTVYINAMSCAAEAFPVIEVETVMPGLEVRKVYPKGYKGATNDKGLSAAAASCATLDPSTNDVIRLAVRDETAFRRLLAWYSGEARLAR